VALRTRGLVTVGAAVACCALAAACTSEPTSVTTPSLTPPATTPTESQVERQMRLDYEAAEKAYTSALAERERQAALGIAKSSPALKANATGAYLDLVLKALRYAHDRHWHASGSTRVLGIVRNGWQEHTVHLIACEDSSPVRLIDKAGKDVTSQKVRTYVQDLTVDYVNGGWKVADVSTTVVKSFEGQLCAA
jgi:hypothetical protein